MKENDKFYLPILKSKSGEFTALSKLDAYTRKRIIPLLEITPMEWDHTFKTKPTTIEEHLIKFSQKITKFWALDECFIDTTLLTGQMIDKTSCLEFIFSRLSSSTLFDIKAIPVIEVSTQDDVIIGVKNILTQHKIGQAGLRITLNALTNPKFKGMVDELLGKIMVTAASIHVILDLKNSDFTQTEDYSDAIIASLEDFPYFKEWKTFSICGGAFPSSELIHKNENIIPRYDWKLFQAICKKLECELCISMKVTPLFRAKLATNLITG
ncbi:hypothetical protein HDC90_004309 [Pedobacter sp. AK013]|uniref:beta family protein n=1 Tax=Pedobacter sp. AK013 TaxID=2723071 RepID=UPI0016071D11|nr:hypothetical protein [Pedobacter sp. AK013]MBB6239651.1 hypothetical protein [Pedobacter sp. AK013]